MIELKLKKHPIADIKDHTNLYAFVCPDPGEGIISYGDDPRTQKPLVFMSRDVAEKFVPLVKEMVSFGHNIELREYTLSKILKGFQPIPKDEE